MVTAVYGDTVSVHYIGFLEDGTEFERTGDEPVRFTIGEGEVLAAFEGAVIGMHPGESRRIHIPAANAFGEYREDLVEELDREAVPGSDEAVIGQILSIPHGGDSVLHDMTVVDLSDNTITLDANHPLAGHGLVYNIQLVGVE